jgi:Na+/H+-translocating membrane pyrophosphatase
MSTVPGGKAAPDGVHESDYYGYGPKSPQDFPFEEDKSFAPLLDSSLANIVDPKMLRDHGRVSVVLLLGMAFFALSFVVLLVWFFLLGGAGECKVKRLCDVRDRSSYATGGFVPKNFEFLVPAKLVWISLAISCVGLLTAACYAFSVLRCDVGTAGMAAIAAHIHAGSYAFLTTEFLAMLLPLFVIFIIVGVGPGWRVAAGFIFGSLLSAAACYAGLSIATSGNVRTCAAAQSGALAGLKVAFRTGAVVGLAMVSLGLAGISFAYLMFQDIRTLGGFAVGASIVALFARIAGGVFAKAADIGADAVGKFEEGVPVDDPRNPASIADLVGDNVGTVAGGSADYFESFVGSIAAAALLGATLPFFHRDQYAMCVFNHLYIDARCGPFGYPQQLSYAAFVCKANDFYLKYPRLSVWQSNATFVALPFLLAAVGVLASVLATVHVRVGPAVEDEQADKAGVIRSLLRSVRVNTVLAGLLVVGGAAALCFSLFGRGSAFQRGAGLGSAENLPVFRLSDEPNACINTFLLPGSTDTSTLVPSGDFSNSGRYRPLSTIGFQFGEARQTPWRLWGCILIGLALGQAITYLAAYSTAAAYGPTQGIASAGAYGAGAVIIQGLGAGMAATVLPMALVVSSILGSYNLFGYYGVALCSVALLSTLGLTLGAVAYGPVADNAVAIAEMARPPLPRAVRKTSDALDVLGNTAAVAGGGFANVSAVLTALALLAALIHESGLTPSPRDLAGTPRLLGRVLVGSTTLAGSSSLVDIFVVASVFIGIMLPFLFSGLVVLSVSRVARTVTFESRRQLRQVEGLRAGTSGAKPDYAHCVRTVARSAVLETVVPAAAVIMAPLIVGFGFGQMALVGMLLGAVGSGYLLSTVMSHAGGAWDNAKKLVESGHHGEGCGGGSEWHASTAAADTVGDPLKDTAGPSLNVCIKVMCAIGLVAVPIMEPDRRTGWIGAILLAVFIVCATVFGVWNVRRTSEAHAALREGDDVDADDWATTPPPKRVSPFYVAGSTWAPETVVPGSQMHEALAASGRWALPVDVSRLPGVSDRDEVDIQNLQHVKTAP